MAIYITCSNIELVFTSRIVRCWFLVGRSRSPPVRPISIPRRALPAATLSMKIYTKCSWMSGWPDLQDKQGLLFGTNLRRNCNISKMRLSDFSRTFPNQVAAIHEIISPDKWRHCPWNIYPTDDASLSSQQPWWKGPDFLWETEDCWRSWKYEEVPVQPVSERTHHNDNYTDDFNKTRNWHTRKLALRAWRSL